VDVLKWEILNGAQSSRLRVIIRLVILISFSEAKLNGNRRKNTEATGDKSQRQQSKFIRIQS
jgi:hypothetical protein